MSTPATLSITDYTVHWVTYVVPTIVATVAIALRFFSRISSKIPLSWDDFWIVLAGIFFWGWAATSIYVNTNRTHFTGDFTTTPLDGTVLLLKGTYAGTLFVVAILSTAKLSILCLYKRIFQVKRWFRIAINCLLAASALWWFATSLATILQCIPVQAAWDPALAPTAKCINQETLFLATETINCITEVIMIILPIHLVIKLHLPLRYRVGIILIFAVGLFVAATSILRMASAYSPGSGSGGIVNSGFYAVIQCCTAVVTACLPTYRGLLPRDWKIIASLHRLYTNLLSRRRRRTSPSRESESIPQGPSENEIQLTKMDAPRLRPDTDSISYETSVVSDPYHSVSGEGRNSNGIRVEHAVSVV